MLVTGGESYSNPSDVSISTNVELVNLNSDKKCQLFLNFTLPEKRVFHTQVYKIQCTCTPTSLFYHKYSRMVLFYVEEEEKVMQENHVWHWSRVNGWKVILWNITEYITNHGLLQMVEFYWLGELSHLCLLNFLIVMVDQMRCSHWDI